MPAHQPMIRRATLVDADGVTNLTNAAYGKYVVSLGRKPQPMTTDYQHFIAEHPVWLLEIGPETVGVLALQHQQDALLIYSVAISPPYQKRGFGRQLLAWAEHEAFLGGYSSIRLYTNARMERNIALYNRLGYQETRREPISRGVVVHMEKELVGEDTST